MMNYGSVVMIFLLFVQSWAFGQTNAWNNILPLKSTRTDVEKALGSAMNHSVSREVVAYKTNEGKVSITYSTGPCRQKHNNGWNVPKYTVISISFIPDSKPTLADLGFEIDKFEKRPDSGILYATVYKNHRDGISITVRDTSGTVEFFNYFPRLADEHLRCSRGSS